MSPRAKASIRVALMNTSSKAPRFLVVGKIFPIIGAETCVAVKRCIKKSLRNAEVRGLTRVKSIGLSQNCV